MDVTPLIKRDAQVIQGYGPGFVRVSSVTYDHPVVVMAGRTVAWSGLADDLPALIPDAELVLMGTGAQIVPVDADLRACLRARGAGVEVMDTGAACRTYNVLMAEGRRVAAALVPMPVAVMAAQGS